MNEYLISFYYWINDRRGLGNAFVDISEFESEKMDKETLNKIRKYIMDEKSIENLTIISFNKLEG